MSDGKKLTVHNPMGYPPKVSSQRMAPRLDTLDGKTIYLVDARFDDSVLLLQEIQNWFAEHLPSVNTRVVQMSSVYTQDDPKTWTEIRERGDAAIIGVGH